MYTEHLSPFGMMTRGGFHPTPEDDLGTVRTLILVGSIGGSFWDAFSKSRKDEPDPLDSWTKRILNRVGAVLGVEVAYPFDGPPHLPFQSWAMRAEGIKAAPCGPLIHPEFGLWHSYHGALLFTEEIAIPESKDHVCPCDTCADKPCLTACPVEAISHRAYDLKACIAHLEDAPDPCAGGCLSRRACPVGANFAYPPAQGEFHMDAFKGALLWT